MSIRSNQVKNLHRSIMLPSLSASTCFCYNSSYYLHRQYQAHKHRNLRGTQFFQIRLTYVSSNKRIARYHNICFCGICDLLYIMLDRIHHTFSGCLFLHSLNVVTNAILKLYILFQILRAIISVRETIISITIFKIKFNFSFGRWNRFLACFFHNTYNYYIKKGKVQKYNPYHKIGKVLLLEQSIYVSVISYSLPFIDSFPIFESSFAWTITTKAF